MFSLIGNITECRKDNFKTKILLIANRKMNYLFEKVYIVKGKVTRSDIKRKMLKEITLIDNNIKLFTEDDLITILTIDKYDFKFSALENIYKYFENYNR